MFSVPQSERTTVGQPLRNEIVINVDRDFDVLTSVKESAVEKQVGNMERIVVAAYQSQPH